MLASLRTRPRRRLMIGTVAVATMAVTSLAGCRPEPESLSITSVVTGLQKPWDLAFTPQGDMVFTERVGRINIRLGGSGNPVRTLEAPTDVWVAGEGGMLGIAVDPNFSSNRRIYTCFQSSAPAGPTNDVRLVRWRLNEARTALTDRTDIVTGIPTVTGRHTGCRPRF